MKRSAIYTAVIFTALLVRSIQGYSQESSFRNSISITQQNNIYTSTKLFDSVHLNRDTFAISFETRKYNEKQEEWYAAQIAAITNDSLLLILKPGQKLENTAFFSLGTGLAADEFGYNNLFIDNEAHHHITYTDKKERRAELVSANGDMVKLKWNIPMAYYQNQDVEFSKLPLSSFHLVIFNDGNLNKVMDEGEYWVVFITLQ